MSLRAFHILFIITASVCCWVSALLCWSISGGALGLQLAAATWAAVGAGLIWYAIARFRKIPQS